MGTSRNKFCSKHQMRKGSGEIENHMEKDWDKEAGVGSSVLEWGPKGGAGSDRLEKNCGGLMRRMAQQGQMLMIAFV